MGALPKSDERGSNGTKFHFPQVLIIRMRKIMLNAGYVHSFIPQRSCAESDW